MAMNAPHARSWATWGGCGGAAGLAVATAEEAGSAGVAWSGLAQPAARAAVAARTSARAVFIMCFPFDFSPCCCEATAEVGHDGQSLLVFRGGPVGVGRRVFGGELQRRCNFRAEL